MKMMSASSSAYNVFLHVIAFSLLFITIFNLCKLPESLSFIVPEKFQAFIVAKLSICLLTWGKKTGNRDQEQKKQIIFTIQA